MSPASLSAIRALFEADERILLAYVFGSVARGEATAPSDLDVAVLASNELGLDERGRLSEAIARATGYERTVDLVDLRSAPPALAAEVVRHGERCFERDPLVRFDFEMAAMRRNEDTRPLRRLQHDLLREAARGRP